MMLCAIFTMLAATASFEPAREAPSASLGVTATVVRPVEISPPSIDSGGAVVTIRNTLDVEVLVAGASADTSDPDTTILTGDGAGPVVITLVY